MLFVIFFAKREEKKCQSQSASTVISSAKRIGNFGFKKMDLFVFFIPDFSPLFFSSMSSTEEKVQRNHSGGVVVVNGWEYKTFVPPSSFCSLRFLFRISFSFLDFLLDDCFRAIDERR